MPAASKAGRSIPELGLRRIEKGERRIDFDDLMAIAFVLKICPVDLMISNEATDEPYSVTPERRFKSDSVRDWISGGSVILIPFTPPEEIFSDPATVMYDALQWMPKAVEPTCVPLTEKGARTAASGLGAAIAAVR
jgi:hypothetical protein